MRFRAPASGALAGLAATLLAGCGSAPLSLVALRARASTVCTRTNHQLQALAPPSSERDAQPFLEHGIAALRPELNRLQALSAGGDARDVYRAALGAQSRELAALLEAVRSLRAGNSTVSVFRLLEQRLSPLETQANSAWSALGIPACVNR